MPAGPPPTWLPPGSRAPRVSPPPCVGPRAACPQPGRSTAPSRAPGWPSACCCVRQARSRGRWGPPSSGSFPWRHSGSLPPCTVRGLADSELAATGTVPNRGCVFPSPPSCPWSSAAPTPGHHQTGSGPWCSRFWKVCRDPPDALLPCGGLRVASPGPRDWRCLLGPPSGGVSRSGAGVTRGTRASVG